MGLRLILQIYQYIAVKRLFVDQDTLGTRITALRAYARPLRGKMYVARFARLGGCLIYVVRCAR